MFCCCSNRPQHIRLLAPREARAPPWMDGPPLSFSLAWRGWAGPRASQCPCTYLIDQGSRTRRARPAVPFFLLAPCGPWLRASMDGPECARSVQTTEYRLCVCSRVTPCHHVELVSEAKLLYSSYSRYRMPGKHVKTASSDKNTSFFPLLTENDARSKLNQEHTWHALEAGTFWTLLSVGSSTKQSNARSIRKS